jgi:hypothetical protein
LIAHPTNSDTRVINGGIMDAPKSKFHENLESPR